MTLIAFKRTQDDWYPNYNKHYVKVRFHGNISPPHQAYPPCYRVSVWGNDDIGMNRDFENEWEAKDMFRKITTRKVKFVNYECLEALGFEMY